MTGYLLPPICFIINEANITQLKSPSKKGVKGNTRLRPGGMTSCQSEPSMVSCRYGWGEWHVPGCLPSTQSPFHDRGKGCCSTEIDCSMEWRWSCLAQLLGYCFNTARVRELIGQFGIDQSIPNLGIDWSEIRLEQSVSGSFYRGRCSRLETDILTVHFSHLFTKIRALKSYLEHL